MRSGARYEHCHAGDSPGRRRRSVGQGGSHLRAGTVRAKPRTQSSIFVRPSTGTDGVLFNASPDVLEQIRSSPIVQPGRAIRVRRAVGANGKPLKMDIAEIVGAARSGRSDDGQDG